ncbi:mitochondrial 37S ribosomal protein mS42 [Calcarisporiella thermophila]|uniref:mitochondrial 37S ribosomal protein mS42 n=1 Tax=Calcarisporiella thermophila TaxID=911321 RepID=UPI0037436D81
MDAVPLTQPPEVTYPVNKTAEGSKLCPSIQKFIAMLRRLLPLHSPSSFSRNIIQVRNLHRLNRLPFPASEGISPFLSPAAVRVLWEEHQQGLLERLNQLVVGTDLEHASVFELVTTLAENPLRANVFNVASQAWNNEFFLRSLTSSPARAIRFDLQKRITEDFGGIEELKAKFTDEALSLCGSGFVFLVESPAGKLDILTTYNGGTPHRPWRTQATDPNTKALSSASIHHPPQHANSYIPLLGLSVWEHAYLTDYGVRGKEDYVKKFWEAVDWERVYFRVPKQDISSQ